MNMDIDQISGAELDYLVAIAEGYSARIAAQEGNQPVCIATIPPARGYVGFHPSRNWWHGGPIMERNDIGPWKQPDAYGNEDCMAMVPVCDTASQHMICAYGKTYLEAAMRCLVKLKLSPKRIEEALNRVRTK